MEQIPILFNKVKQQCPTLCPVFYPGDVTEKQVLQLVAERKKLPKPSSKCALCESKEGTMNPQVVCDYDIEKRKMQIKQVKV